MCDPATAALALSIGSTVSGLQVQRQQAKAQTEFNNKQYAAAVQNRNENLAFSNAEAEQERQGAADRLDAIEQERQSRMATARVSAGEAGVSGLSVNALLSELSGDAGDAATATITNYLRGQQGIALQQRNINNQAESTINSLKSVAKPDLFGAALKIGGAGLDYYNAKNPKE